MVSELSQQSLGGEAGHLNICCPNAFLTRNELGGYRRDRTEPMAHASRPDPLPNVTISLPYHEELIRRPYRTRVAWYRQNGCGSESADFAAISTERLKNKACHPKSKKTPEPRFAACRDETATSQRLLARYLHPKRSTAESSCVGPLKPPFSDAGPKFAVCQRN